jgi:hypothetical protein
MIHDRLELEGAYFVEIDFMVLIKERKKKIAGTNNMSSMFFSTLPYKIMAYIVECNLL